MLIQPMLYVTQLGGFKHVHRSEADNQPRAGLDWVSGVLVINASTKPPSRRDNTTQHWEKIQVVVNGHQSGPKPFLAFCCGGGSEPTTILFRVEPKTKAHTD